MDRVRLTHPWSPSGQTASTARLPAEGEALAFATPAADEFAFTPPKGAKVTEVTPEDHPDERTSGAEKTGKAEKPTVVGEGWTTVVVGRLPGLCYPGTVRVTRPAAASVGRTDGDERMADLIQRGLAAPAGRSRRWRSTGCCSGRRSRRS